MLNWLYFSTCNITLSRTEEETRWHQGVHLQFLPRHTWVIFCILPLAFSSRSPMMHSGVQALSECLRKGLVVCLGCFACMGKDASLILRKQTEKRAVNLKAGRDYRGIQELRRGHVRLPLLLASVRSTKMWGLSWHKSRCLHAAALNDTTGRFGAARFLLSGCAAPKHHLYLQQHLSKHQNIHLRI